ncbi:MAG: branched-chain amino acid transporter AzlD [Erysipelotrichaceae bacterium]|nr:branched-chain amino acid transporter AzlD [Erysipelotrichaceae bacterium]
MTSFQAILTILICSAATILIRFLPFAVFSGKRKTPEYVLYLGRALPPAIFSMLVVYCLKGVSLFQGSHGIPEAIASAVTVALHLWKRQTLLSIAGGTLCYMFLVQMIF